MKDHLKNARNTLFGKPIELKDKLVHHVGPVKYSDPNDVAVYEVDALHLLRTIYKGTDDRSWPPHNEVLQDLERAGYRIVKTDTIPVESLDLHEVNRRLDDFRHTQTAWNKTTAQLQVDMQQFSQGPRYLDNMTRLFAQVKALDQKVSKHIRVSQKRNRVLRERVRALEKSEGESV